MPIKVFYDRSNRTNLCILVISKALKCGGGKDTLKLMFSYVACFAIWYQMLQNSNLMVGQNAITVELLHEKSVSLNEYFDIQLLLDL